MLTWAQRIQQTTKAGATRHGEPWLTSDLELLEAFEGEANAELAAALGRTLYAVQSVKQAVREGARRPARTAASDRPYRGFKIGDDEGWD